MKIKFKMVCFFSIAILTSGCAAPQSNGNNTFNSTLWLQTASEYKANAIQAYNSAAHNIDKAIADRSWTAALEQEANGSPLPPAIILDVDETVLDNSQYQAQLLIDGATFDPESWDRWIAMKSAPAVPGAVDFINSVSAMGVEVIFITNRECKPISEAGPPCPQETDTIDNLLKVGITEVTPENILLKREKPEWSSEKKSRREEIAMRYRILMLFGDDLGDFLPDVKKDITPMQRDRLVDEYRDNWGVKWFVFSNPTYGSWMGILDEPKVRYLKGY
ncbi:HAD family acid phosphatase [uncultured Desulfosarcina sp.]|uniref:5'-nucleotidase, lipoprotein e(P4) family n=1 Tax=uncultured Desulfosarcina sp. TaxID=218289 RepID=UPI0029C77186|nr:HAD family acid phosphatase [uncultured Desulfosarcina sp.]